VKEPTLSSKAVEQDWLWVQQFRHGEKSAFQALFTKYKPLLINLAFRFVKEKEAAEDIAQDIFIKIYEKRIPFSPKAKFSTWIYRITVNAALDFLRKKKFYGHSLDKEISIREGEKKTFLETLEDSRSSSTLEALEKEELRKLIQREIDKLPEKLRTPLLLYQFQNMPYREISAILGVTEKAVERRLSHAKELLRKKVLKFL
jgi:RNA polymerase sigma-70 factor (ECF subfamily)